MADIEQIDLEPRKLDVQARESSVAIETSHNLLVDYLLDHDCAVHSIPPHATENTAVVDEFCMEVPAGGSSPGLTQEEVALRELVEDVGRIASKLHYVGQFYTSNGISKATAYVYLAISIACLSSSAGSRLPLAGELAKANLQPSERSTELTPRADGDLPGAD